MTPGRWIGRWACLPDSLGSRTKNATLASYSYRVTRDMNRQFLLQRCRIFHDPQTETGEFNLDFKAIPHWGNERMWETNWSGSRSKRIKSVLALLVQDPVTGLCSYTEAEVKHAHQNEAILNVVDFWIAGRGVAPKMLIFDSNLTTYKNLSTRNHDDIKFLTLWRRGKKLSEHGHHLQEHQWQTIELDKPKRKHTKLKVYDDLIHLTDYEGQVRQIIVTEHGHHPPTFSVTNDFEAPIKTLVLKYARRWLVENELAEQILFFHLNQTSSAIVIHVDFDLTLSLVAHNLYKKLHDHLPGFEGCTGPTISRKFIRNGARITIEPKTITVHLKKKIHRREQYALLLDIHRLLTQWFLQPHERLIQLDVSNINAYIPHSLPQIAEKQRGFVEFWSDEIGRLLSLHDRCCPSNQFFIGIACGLAFTGDDTGKYDNANNQKTFPLDAYEWLIPPGMHQKKIRYGSAKQNIVCIGGKSDRVEGDHFVYVFEGARSWPLTLRDPVPDRHLQQFELDKSNPMDYVML